MSLKPLILHIINTSSFSKMTINALLNDYINSIFRRHRIFPKHSFHKPPIIINYCHRSLVLKHLINPSSLKRNLAIALISSLIIKCCHLTSSTPLPCHPIILWKSEMINFMATFPTTIVACRGQPAQGFSRILGLLLPKHLLTD